MDTLINWYKLPQNSLAVIGVLVVLVFLLIIKEIISFAITRRRVYKKYLARMKSVSMTGIYIVTIILSILSVYIIHHINSLRERYSQLSMDQLSGVEITLADMQANTLTICAIVLTITTIIISLLMLYKERKSEINERRIDENIKEIEDAEEAIKKLSNIVSMTFVGEKQRECYYDAVNQIIESNRENSPFYNHFLIAKMSMISNYVDSRDDEINLNSVYTQLIATADEILSRDDVTEIDSQFAYLEALHALYLKIKNSVQTNSKTEEEDIDKAFRYLNRVSGISSDTFGHINNLAGLTYLWVGMAQVRKERIDEGKRNIEHSLAHLNLAIEKNREKIEFHNHKAVALQQLYDLTTDEALNMELMKTYEYILSIRPTYAKANLNYAGTILRNVKREMKLPMLDRFPDFRKYIQIPEVDYSKLLNQLDIAKEKLYIAQREAPYFVNNYYKMSEVITVQLVIYSLQHGTPMPGQIVKLVLEAKNCFEKANEISKQSIPCMLCECAFRRFIGEDPIADEIEEKARKAMGRC